MKTRWYLKNEKIRKTVLKILALLDGLTYDEAELILNCTNEEIRFNSFVCQVESIHQQCVQKPNNTPLQNLQE